MKPYILFIAILTLHMNAANGQAGVFTNGVGPVDTSIRPLVLVGGLQTDINSVVLNPGNIASMDVYKDSAAIAKYGQAGKYGVIVIHPKEHIEFLRVDKILDQYHIAKQDRLLRICINKTLIKDPALILIEKTELLNAEITTDRNWINVEDANTGEKFINIITQTRTKNSF